MEDRGIEDGDAQALGGELTGGESDRQKEGSARKVLQSMAASAFRRVPRKMLRILGFFGKTWEK
jgi:hypothetical protein